MDWNQLMDLAREARKQSYAPYSNFWVGAAALGESGKVYCGCNVENSSYPVGICAEKNAVGHGIAQGEHFFTQIAIAGGPGNSEEEACFPCGNCRQFLREFVRTPEKLLIGVWEKGKVQVYSLEQLLPHSFSLRQNEEGIGYADV